MYAAIGTDGRDPVVWGVGESRDEALIDAGRSFAENEIGSQERLIVKSITDRQWRRVMAGEVSTQDLGIELDAGDVRELTGVL